MIILVYIGIILLSYGIYNTLCYVFMLPTAKAGRHLSRIGTEESISFPSIASQSISGMLVRKWDLKWNHAEVFEEILKARRIYSEGTVYLISRFILLFSGVLWILPAFLINRTIFWLLTLFCILWGLREALRLMPRKNIDKEKNKRKMIDIACRLLLGAFFITQILVFANMLT